MAELGWNPAICEWAASAWKVYYCVLVILCTLNALGGPICEWAVSASSVHYMFLLSLSTRVGPSVSGLYLPRVCIICSCCHSRHEWTHLLVGCICLGCALYVLVVTLGMSGLICEWAVSALSVHYMFLLSFGMSGPICEWAVSAWSMHYMFLLSLSP